MQEVLVFAGTSEGRNLARQLAQNEILVTVCVATQYGREVLEEEMDSRIQVRIGRLTKVQMEELLLSRSWWTPHTPLQLKYLKILPRHVRNKRKNIYVF